MIELRKKQKRLAAIMLSALAMSGLIILPGCGRSAGVGSFNDQGAVTIVTDGASDESESEISEDGLGAESDGDSLTNEEEPEEEAKEFTVEMMKNRDVTYATDNVSDTLEGIGYAPVPVTVDNFCDAYAIDYASENNCEDHLLWLADYAVNCVEPQAVDKLLQIPALREAADNGEISRYFSVYVTYNDVNGFGAMEQSCYLGRDGHGVEKWDSPFYMIGHNVLINLESFKPGMQDDKERLLFMESSMIHEMMHAFMTDYLFNLSLGTGRDGARIFERDAAGNIIMDEDDRPKHVDEIPRWLQEGLAMAVENPYGTRRYELREQLCAGVDDDEYLSYLSTPESLNDLVNVEFEEIGKDNMARITEEENTYTTGWVATLFLCAMAGEKLGYEVFDENGVLNTEAVFYGLNDFITQIHDGHSLDYVIADISFDMDKGEAVYKDTADFEEKCFGSVDDSGLIFMQKLLYDLEARSQQDPDSYIASGSVLLEYPNGAARCMDSYYHNPAEVYEVDNIDDSNPNGEYFSLSTIQMSKVALGGGRRTSYDPLLFPLSEEEEEERDYCYIGDEKEYIDLSLEDE